MTDAPSNHPLLPQTPRVPHEVLAALGSMRRPIVLSHVVPDADALGSMIAMWRAWSSDACRPLMALPDGSVSQRLGFLLELGKPTIAGDADFAEADGFIALDTAKLGRCNVGRERKQRDWVSGRPLVNIDHHETNTRYGSVNWVQGHAGSTCELVYWLLRAADRPVDSITASALYAGIQTDTLGFSLPSTSASAFLACADLVARGVNVAELGERLCRSQSAKEFALLRVVYANTQTLAEGRIAYSTASYDEIHGSGCTAADIDEQINIPRSLAGVELAMLFSEGERGRTRINFRASGDVTVADLAARFGGGGHAQAAGAVLDCTLKEALDRVLPEARRYLEGRSS